MSAGSLGLGYVAGLLPLGTVMGVAVISIGKVTTSGLDGREHAGLKDAVNMARELAFKRIRMEAILRKASGVVAVDFEMQMLSEEVLEIRCAGTAVANPAAGLQTSEPFLSTLSVAEHWALAQLGYAPREIVFGFCKWHQSLGYRSSNMKLLINSEHPDFTRGLATARNLAHSRLYEQARLVKAQGVVGVVPNQEIRRSQEGMEYQVSFLGTAVSFTAPGASAHNVTPSVLIQ